MATEKYFVHKEDGSLVRLKGRLVRFLDEEPPTGSDKSAIRTALEVSPDAQGLVQADVGTDPNEIPVNGMLGSMSVQDADSVAMGTVEADGGITTTAAGTNTQLKLKRTSTATGEFDVYTNTNKLYFKNVGGGNTYPLTLDGSNVGAGTVSPDKALTVKSGTINTDVARFTGANDDRGLVISTSANGITNDATVEYDAVSASTAGQHVFKTDGTTAVTIDSSQRVGIGTASPSAGAVGGKVVHVQSTGETASVRVDRSDASTAGTLSLTAGNSTLGVYGTGSKDLAFSTNGTTRWTINSSGNLVANGTAIDFGSGTSTTLDAYEEGSATVSIVPDGGTVTLKSANQTIYYRKIGTLVHIAGELVINSVSSPTGEFKISGLPYASEDVNNNRSAISIHTSVLSSSSRLAAFVERNQNFAYVRLTGGTGYGQTSATVLQANSGIVIGGSYHTA